MSWGRNSGQQQPYQRQEPRQQQQRDNNSCSSNRLDTEPSSSNHPPASRGGGPGPIKSANGWIIFVTGIHPPLTDGTAVDEEEDWIDVFSEFGQVCKFTMNRDRQTGACQGYALVEFAEYTEAQDAINALHGKQILGNVVGVDWAFVQPTTASRSRRNNRNRR